MGIHVRYRSWNNNNNNNKKIGAGINYFTLVRREART